MTTGGWQQAQTIVVPGVQLASGTSVKYPIFNEDGGTLRLQIPEFKQRGLDVEAYFGGDYFCGTLNLSCAPRIVRIGQPHYFLKDVRWTDKCDEPDNPDPSKRRFKENFYLDKAEVVFKERGYKALLYIPDPATKPEPRAATNSVVEVIAPPITGIGYGDSVMLVYNQQAIMLE